MYSPKISEVFIPTLYRMAKEQGVRMTALVNRIINEEIQKHKEKETKND
jgi:post-segregation antitoxin (ccd killing protein)